MCSIMNSMYMIVFIYCFAFCVWSHPLSPVYGQSKVENGEASSYFILPVEPTTIPPEANYKTDMNGDGSFDKLGIRTYGREVAAVEKESIVSKFDTLYGRKQEFFAKEPIVDSLKESDKYGNDGKVSRFIGHTVVGGFEIFSNIVNGVIELPRQKGAETLKTVNRYLGGLGAKFAG